VEEKQPVAAAPRDVEHIAGHIARALRQAAHGDFPTAFDEIGKAFILDPMCPTVQDAEAEIQRMFVEFEEMRATSSGDENAEYSTVLARQAPDPHAVTERLKTEFSDLREQSPEPVNAQRRHPRRAVQFAASIVLLLIATGVILTSATDPGREPGKGATVKEEQPEDSAKPGSVEPVTQPKSSRPVASGKTKGQKARTEKIDEPTLAVSQDMPVPEPVPETRMSDTQPDRATKSNTSATGAPSRNNTETEPIKVEEPPQGEDRTSSSGPVEEIVSKPAQIARLEKPLFPDNALRSGYTEEVIVRVEISPDGKPLRNRIIKSTNPFLTQPVIEAVMSSTYTPGLSGGSPQTTWLTIPFRVKKN
jgi:outer membrane biosynthesis protein TonB